MFFLSDIPYFRLKVIASAGSDAKVDYMRSLGADVPFNYQTTPVSNILREHGPINLYWDNVGGETLEAAIEYSAVHGSVIVSSPALYLVDVDPETLPRFAGPFPSTTSPSKNATESKFVLYNSSQRVTNER